MMILRKFSLYLILVANTCCLSVYAQDTGQEVGKNAVSISTEEGIYRIVIPDEDLVETTFIEKDSVQIPEAASDSLFVELGSASEEITLSTAPVSDTLKIDLEGLQLTVVKEPFSLNYIFSSSWFNTSNGKKFSSRDTYKVTNKDNLISKLARGGSLFSSVKAEGEELWQVHYLFEAGVKEKNETFCPEDFEQLPGEDCINVSYRNSGKEIVVEVNAASTSPTLDEVEFIIHGLENRIKFVWLNNIKYTSKNFLHQGKQIIPLRFDNPENILRIELK